jgi:hypothetical protein
MHNKSTPVKSKRDADTSRFAKRIGSTLYKINVIFSKTSSETIDDKIIRLVKNDTSICENVTKHNLKPSSKCAIIKELQTESLSERSSA